MNVIQSFPQIMVEFERRYRADHYQEHGLLLDSSGEVVVSRSGDFDSVAFTPDELNRARGGMVTHSHPRALPPSADDLALAAEYGLTLRAVGVSPEGDQWEYTVRFPMADKKIAKKIKIDFDNWQEDYERRLAIKALTDLAWQREARHLTVRKAAHHYNFDYQRVLRNGKLSEARKEERARLNMLSDADQALREDVLNELQDKIARSLRRFGAGPLPIGALPQIQADIAAVVQQVMLGKPDAHGTLAPYSTVRGDVVPRSVFMATLWSLMQKAASMAISRHADMMREKLPADIVRSLENATVSPLEDGAVEALTPLQLWIGPDKKQLADRIWAVAGDIKRKLTDFVTTGVSSGRTAAQIEVSLGKYLNGTGGYEIMRLGRTMTAFAFSRADAAAAQQNPLVDSYSFFTAPQHKCCDICDEYEAGSPYDKDDLAHLPPVHPECICSVRWNESDDIDGVIDRLRRAIEDGLTHVRKSIGDIIGPLSRRFLHLLFRGN